MTEPTIKQDPTSDMTLRSYQQVPVTITLQKVSGKQSLNRKIEGRWKQKTKLLFTLNGGETWLDVLKTEVSERDLALRTLHFEIIPKPQAVNVDHEWDETTKTNKFLQDFAKQNPEVYLTAGSKTQKKNPTRPADEQLELAGFPVTIKQKTTIDNVLATAQSWKVAKAELSKTLRTNPEKEAIMKHLKTQWEMYESITFVAMDEEFSIIKEVAVKMLDIPFTKQVIVNNVVLDEFKLEDDATAKHAICCMNGMGMDRMQSMVTSVLTSVTAKHAFNVGISGAVNKELDIGDLVYATTVSSYLDSSKGLGASAEMVDKKIVVQLELQLIPSEQRLSENRQLQALVSLSSPHFKEWKNSLCDKFDVLAGIGADVYRHEKEKVAEALNNFSKKKPPTILSGSKYGLVCGPSVMKSKAFADIIKMVSAPNAVAADMESAGFAGAIASLGHGSPEPHVLRAISDLADEDKADTETKMYDANRAWPLSNCTRLLFMFLKQLAQSP